MEYTIEEMIARKGRARAETDYICSPPDMLNFRLISGDFYEWNGGKLRFKQCVDIMDASQVAEVFPPFAGVGYKSREKFPYFAGNLDALTEAMERGETVAVEGDPCLFGEYEVTVSVRLDDGETRLFDYANGKAYLNGTDFEESDGLSDYLRLHGARVVDIGFRQDKWELTPQEYLNLLYPFEIAAALGGPLVIPIPNMSYRKYLLYALDAVPEDIRKRTLDEFDAILNRIADIYLDTIAKLQARFQIERFACVHRRDPAPLEVWYDRRAAYIKKIEDREAEPLPGHLIRLLVFACYNITATFLPVWILRNSGLFPEASRDFMASLPLTVNIFVMGLMSLSTAGAVRHLGLGRIMTLSTMCSLAGNLLMFLFPSYFAIFLGLFIDGVGVGLIMNATYVLLTYVKDEANRQWGFTLYNAASLSGINFGMLLGSLLAVVIGQRPVFLIVASVWFCLTLVGNLILRQLAGLLAGESQEEAGEKATISFGRFLFNKPVMSFIVLIQNPYIVFNSFVFYFVPLFCGNRGYDETIVSILIMVYSEVAVLTGDTLMQRVTKLFGNKGMYAAYLTNIAALMIFALARNMLGVTLALLMMGTAAAYGKPLQQTWFLKQKQVQQYGEDRAMGVYNFTENIGESLGPVVFAHMMAQRPLLGAVSAFCAGVAALGAGHFALNRKELKEV